MAPAPSERLLAALLKADTSTTTALSSFLTASHTSHAALSAYASVHQPPLGDVLRAIEASLRGVHEAVRTYVGAMELWTGELGELKEREEEVGQVRRDRDILVTRLIKASKLRPASTHGLGSLLTSSSPHSSALSLPSPSDQPKLAHAQAELQACEQHLALRQRNLDEVTKAAVARGVMRRAAALDELAQACRTASGRARNAIGALVPAKYQNGTGTPYDKPLPNPSPYAHRPPPRAGSTSTDSLSPSQSASQIAHVSSHGHGPAHASAPHLPHVYPEQGMQRQSSEYGHGHGQEQRLSLVVPPAHAISPTFIPDSRLLPPPERAQTPTGHHIQQQQQMQMQQQRPQSRQQIQPAQEEDGSDSEEHGALVVHENAPRNSMSFPVGTPPQQHPHAPQQQQPQTPVRTRTVSSSTPIRRQSKHIALPSTQSDLGPRGPPPAVQGGSPLTGSLPRPRPRPTPFGHQRRPSSQSLDSYDLPTRQQQKKRGFFGAIAHALHLGGSGGRDGKESPPYGSGSGSGWGKKEKGWNTRTDRRIRDMHGWRSESSDEDGPGGVMVAVDNPRGSVLRPSPDRWASESPSANASGGRRLSRAAGGANANGLVQTPTPTRAPSQRIRPEQRVLSPHDALESRLDASARVRTMSHPGPGPATAGVGATRPGEPFTRMRTISEASGTGNRRSGHEPAAAGLSREGTLGRASGQQAAAATGLARSGTTRSAMSNATAPPGSGSGPSGALSRSGTVQSTMSAPPNSGPGAGVRKKPSPAARQQHRTSGGVSGSPNILSVLDENEPGGRGLVQIKAPPRVLRDPADGLISIKAPPPAGAMVLPSNAPRAIVGQQAAPASPQATRPAPAHPAQQPPRTNGTANVNLARNLSTSTSASGTAHAANLSRNLSTSTSASSAHARSQRVQPPANLHPDSALSPSASSPTAAPNHAHHTPVPSARAGMPMKSALRTRSPSPEPPRPAIALPPPAHIAQPPAAAPTGAVSPATPRPAAAALLTVAQPRPQPLDGPKPRPVSTGTLGTSGDDASAYETGLEEMEDSGSESEYSGTPGQGTPRLTSQVLEDEQSTPIVLRARPVSVPGPVPPLVPQSTGLPGENDSGVSESTAVASDKDKPARRKSVRLDVPPSLTPTPATEDFPADAWKVNMDELANAVPSRSYLSGAPPQRKFQLSDGTPPPPPVEKDLALDALDGEEEDGAGWHMRASSGDSSEEEDMEYARVKRELEEANRRYAQAGHVPTGGKRRSHA